jgi:hypothetical protein
MLLQKALHVLDCHQWTLSLISVPGMPPAPRGSHTATLLDERLYISSGWSDGLVEDWFCISDPFDSSGYSSCLGADFVSQFNRDELADCVFLIDNQSIFCHRVILCTRCPKFRSLLSNDEPRSEIVITKYKLEPFRAFLSFLYSDKVQLASGWAHALIAIADEYEQDQLRAIAQNCIKYGKYFELYNKKRICCCCCCCCCCCHSCF